MASVIDAEIVGLHVLGAALIVYDLMFASQANLVGGLFLWKANKLTVIWMLATDR